MVNRQTYHGLWWIPDGVQRFEATARMGTLTIETDGSAKLDIYVLQKKTPSFKTYCNYKVVWGDTADGFRVTLFDAKEVKDINKPELFCNSYIINRVVLGAHIMTGDEPLYECCVSKYRYLRNWAYDPSVGIASFVKSNDFRCNDIQLLNVDIEDGLILILINIMMCKIMSMKKRLFRHLY